MAYEQGASTVLTVDGVDVSLMCSAVEFHRSADEAETTTFGDAGHGYATTLLNTEITARGVYDDTEGTGTRAVIGAALGRMVTLGYLPGGQGTTAQTCQALVVSYDESVALFEMIAWEAEFLADGDLGVVVDPYPRTYTPTY